MFDDSRMHAAQTVQRDNRLSTVAPSPSTVVPFPIAQQWGHSELPDASGAPPSDNAGSASAREFHHLIEQLTCMAPQDRTARELVDLVAQWEKAQAWIHARQTEVVAELAGRPECQQTSSSRLDVGCTAADEIGLRLRIGPRKAQTMVRRARALHGPQFATLAALEAGDVDQVRADIIVDGLENIVPQVAFLVEDLVLPGAAARTPTQLRRDVQRALIEVDPEDAQKRFERAKAGRYVSKPRLLPNGMAGIWAVLPAVDAIAIDSYLQAVAVTTTTQRPATATSTSTSAGAGRDTRTRDQVRADALLDAIFATSSTELSGSAGVATKADAGTVAGEEVDAEPATRTAVRASTRLSHRCVEVQVVVPLSVLTGSDGQSAHLRGYGAISASEARRIAGDPDATWRRLVTDPVTGVVLDHGRTRYRPPAALADLVRSRDQTCVMPNCSATANNCDIDHTIPFPQGPTSSANLGLLCRRHHLLKTHAGWRLEQTAPGHFRWTTPAGQQTKTGPEPPF